MSPATLNEPPVSRSPAEYALRGFETLGIRRAASASAYSQPARSGKWDRIIELLQEAPYYRDRAAPEDGEPASDAALQVAIDLLDNLSAAKPFDPPNSMIPDGIGGLDIEWIEALGDMVSIEIDRLGSVDVSKYLDGSLLSSESIESVKDIERFFQD